LALSRVIFLFSKEYDSSTGVWPLARYGIGGASKNKPAIP